MTGRSDYESSMSRLDVDDRDLRSYLITGYLTLTEGNDYAHIAVAGHFPPVLTVRSTRTGQGSGQLIGQLSPDLLTATVPAEAWRSVL
jgi:hypothetical protein